jgi:hypothetical protein
MARRALSVLTAGLLGSAATQADLIGFYPFDEASNPQVDASGFGNDLAPGGQVPTYEPDSGLSGGAYRFDGSQWLVSPININPDYIGTLTMGAWVRTTTLAPTLRKIMGHDDGGWDRTIGLDDRGGPFRYTSFTGSNPGPAELPGPRSTNEWTFVAATYDDLSLTLTVYVDVDANTVGDELASATVTDAFFQFGQDTTAIGSLRPDNGDEGWIGYIDNVFLFDHILTREELTALRDKGSPDPAATANPNFSAVSVPDLSAVPKNPAPFNIVIPIRNDGASSPLNISEVTLFGPDAEFYSVASFPEQLAAGASGEIVIALDGDGQVGPFHAAVTILSNDSIQPKSTLDLSATILSDGASDPALVLATQHPVIGARGASPSTVTFQLRNPGATQTLHIYGASISGPDAAHYTLNSFPESIAPGATGNVSVTFDPMGQARPFIAQLDLNSNDSANRFSSIDLAAVVRDEPIRQALIGFYTFDDPANPTRDDSGNSMDLAHPDDGASPVYEAASGFENSGVYSFDGTQRLISPIDISPDVLPELTMGAWVKTSNLESGLRKIMGHDDGGWDRTIGLDNRSPTEFRYSAFVGNSTPLVGLPGPESDSDWTFFAATFHQERAEVAAYLDLDASTKEDLLLVAFRPGSSFGPGWPTTAIGDLRPDISSEGWQGLIDNAFFYSKVLSGIELTLIRNGGKDAILGTGPAPAPEITTVEVTAGGVALTWSSAADTTYSIEYAEAVAGPWTPIATQASQGASTSYTDTDATRRSRPAGFYKIAVQP